MSDEKSQAIVKTLRSNKKVLADVAKWMFERNYHKMYQRCLCLDAENCIGIGLKGDFQGRKCKECLKVYRADAYQKLNAEKE